MEIVLFIVLFILCVFTFFIFLGLMLTIEERTQWQVKCAKLETELLMLRERYERPKITSEFETASKSVESS